jgi:hypothetical protein
MDFWEGIRVEFEKLVEMVTEHYGKGHPESSKESRGCWNQRTAATIKKPIDLMKGKSQNAMSSLKGCILFCK